MCKNKDCCFENENTQPIKLFGLSLKVVVFHYFFIWFFIMTPAVSALGNFTSRKFNHPIFHNNLLQTSTKTAF